MQVTVERRICVPASTRTAAQGHVVVLPVLHVGRVVAADRLKPSAAVRLRAFRAACLRSRRALSLVGRRGGYTRIVRLPALPPQPAPHANAPRLRLAQNNQPGSDTWLNA